MLRLHAGQATQYTQTTCRQMRQGVSLNTHTGLVSGQLDVRTFRLHQGRMCTKRKQDTAARKQANNNLIRKHVLQHPASCGQTCCIKQKFQPHLLNITNSIYVPSMAALCPHSIARVSKVKVKRIRWQTNSAFERECWLSALAGSQAYK